MSASSLNYCLRWHTSWPRGVTVSTLDSESSDRGSNPREAFVSVSAELLSAGKSPLAAPAAGWMSLEMAPVSIFSSSARIRYSLAG